MGQMGPFNRYQIITNQLDPAATPYWPSGTRRTLQGFAAPSRIIHPRKRRGAFHGFGQEIDEGVAALADDGSKTTPTAEELAAAAAAAAPQPIGVIQIFGDGTTGIFNKVGPDCPVPCSAATDFWSQLGTAIESSSPTAADMVKGVTGLAASKTTWKWVALVGVPVGLLAGVFVGRKWAR
jgi:hypothetical protein